MPNRQPLGDIDRNTLPVTPPQKKPRGKTATLITKRSYAAVKPAQRSQRSYRQRKQVAILIYLKHHWYPIKAWPVTSQRKDDIPLDPANGLCRPTFREAAKHFKFLHFNQRVSQPALAQLPLDLSGLRFLTYCIINFDETPIPFKYLNGSTWADKGACTVAGKTDHSGWSKRQATLILYIFADGIQRILPKLIFHSKPSSQGGQIEGNEGNKYSS
ncbi:uncharacterized protein ColSpa_05184 [Colletotrichum spaethianum]|uniref:Uncharacterized protein n=1 Tax=Colletotrichum spaethianum TaxID=700344 RepID=A0AA37LEM0_9PEZI|nr:uncharacterized protein ColSpa_05184 [Colletotrichum spaethianum]GKT45003.1 hypothetical protein ColSpa_05184 [Colletotrichum spaethianum]